MKRRKLIIRRERIRELHDPSIVHAGAITTPYGTTKGEDCSGPCCTLVTTSCTTTQIC
jgi:hypothetical protein